MKTTDEVLKETGISYAMLMRLKDLGVVPKPTLRGRGQGGGRGVVGIFPEEVIAIINWAKIEQKHGLSLTQIAEKWRQRKISEEEIVAPTPNPSISNWATDVFAKLAEKYPEDDFVPGEIKEIKSKSNDSVVVKIKLTRVKRR
jgi:DNA-binding transcriptional MerR regulator